MDICKAENFRGFVIGTEKNRNIAVLAKRSRALLESNPTRNSQAPIYQWEGRSQEGGPCSCPLG